MQAQALIRLIQAHGSAVLAQVARTKGSTPREQGAWMAIAPDGSFSGTIGGGALEWRALAEAQAMLQQAEASRSLTQSLGPDLGQCCGGHVVLELKRYTSADLPHIQSWPEADTRRPLILCGAGHVGRALVLALAPLPFRVTWWDARETAFPAHLPANVSETAADPEALIAAAGEGSFLLILTHSHTLDLQLTAAALKNPEISYVGLIGSATKKARFLSRLAQAGCDENARNRVICPIGMAGITSKLPAAIAASVAVDLLMRDEQLKTGQMPLTARAVTA